MASDDPLAAGNLTHFGQIIELLAQGDVEFIVVGGIAGVLVGTGLYTQDLDILFKVDETNIDRLMGALDPLEPVHLDPLKRKIRLTATELRRNRMNLLETSMGRLDLLPKLSDRWDYEDLLPRTVSYSYRGIEFRALTVEALIETKKAAGRPKDQFALLHLTRIHELESQPEQLDLIFDQMDDPDD